jgi:hypothetical protein
MPESDVKQIGYFNWKGQTFGQITASLKKNQNTITDKYNIFRAGPLPLYRKEIASIDAPTGNPRVSASVDELNRPNGYIIRESDTCCGAEHSIDMTIPNSKYETGGSVELSSYADICFSQAENAKRRLRGSGVIKKNNQGNLTDEGILQFLYNGSFIFNGKTFTIDENQTLCTLAGIISYQGTTSGQSTYIWIPKYAYDAKTLIVGGGAGGGYDVGGGGGAGGLVYNEHFDILSGYEYTIVVGAGSIGGTASIPESNGFNSSINDIIAYGGGSENTTSTNIGSAGGTLDLSGNTTGNPNQGNDGARGDNWKAGGGGGGAGGLGTTGENGVGNGPRPENGGYKGFGGNGGPGLYYSISGTSTLYAAGGAGGSGGNGADNNNTGSTGDDGQGGTSSGGGNGGGFVSYSYPSTYVYSNGSNATAYGSGGGGGGYLKSGGNGKEGIVIFTVTYSVVSARKSNYYTSNAQLLKERNKTYQQNQYKYDKSTFIVSDVHIDAPTQKLNNGRFYQQGAACASDLVARKKHDEINTAASNTKDAFGPETADALAYGIADQVYTKKDKVGFPSTLTPVISKYTGEIQAKCTGVIRRG